MPQRAPSACRTPGCPGLVRNGVCSRCGPLRRQVQAEHDAQRGTSAQRGYDADWQRLRDYHLRAEPTCRMCAAVGRVERATMVDHIVPINDGGARLDESNLQSLCGACHAKKTQADVARRRAG